MRIFNSMNCNHPLFPLDTEKQMSDKYKFDYERVLICFTLCKPRFFVKIEQDDLKYIKIFLIEIILVFKVIQFSSILRIKPPLHE